MDMSKSYIKAGLYGGAVAGVLALLGSIPLLGCLLLPVTCITFFALPIGVGWYAAKLENVKKDDYGTGAKTGVIAGAIMGAIAGTINLVVGVIFSVMGIATTTALDAFSMNSDVIGTSAEGVITLTGAVLGGLCGIVIAVVFDAGFGALGGVIKAAMDDGGSTASKPDAEEAVVVEEGK